jgi:hypothetical protein
MAAAVSDKASGTFRSESAFAGGVRTIEPTWCLLVRSQGRVHTWGTMKRGVRWSLFISRHVFGAGVRAGTVSSLAGRLVTRRNWE